METVLSYMFITWRRSCCRFASHTSRSRRTYCSQNTIDDDDDHAEKSFESEDFCSAEEKSSWEIDPKEINITDPEMSKRMRVLQTEMYLLNKSGAEIPHRLSPKQWTNLLTLRSPDVRADYLQKIWLFEHKKLNQSKVQRIKLKLYLEEKATNSDRGPIIEENSKKHIRYGLNFNTLFRGIYVNKMNRFYHYRLLKAMMYGPDIVVDCGYESTMDSRDLHRCAKEISVVWQENKTSANPFNIRFCNLNENGELFPRVRDMFPEFEEPYLPFNYSSLSYLDLYEKNRIVYLTPYSSQMLTHYQPECIYIIGAVMNNAIRGPLSLAKAKREGLRTAKFPLQLYARWNIGLRSLKFCKALAIMNDLKEEHDWLTIFRHHVPPVKTPQEFAQVKKEIKMQKLIDSRFLNL